jgi:hypothetical protein
LETGSSGGFFMKKAALLTVLVLTSVALGGCFVGKGKAPVVAPSPVITKG